MSRATGGDYHGKGNESVGLHATAVALPGHVGQVLGYTEAVRRFVNFAWFVLVYDVLVVLWGAYVRISFSGDGCGRHWPLCNGELVPHAPQTKMLVEFSHRVSSGGSLVLAVVLFVWALRAFAKGSPVRRAAGFVLGFTGAEAIIGAGLVLLRLVAHDESLTRGVSTSLHLGNTFLLLASIALTARLAAGAPRPTFRRQGALGLLTGATLVSVILVGATGSIAALGDTLYPVHSLAQGLAQDVSAAAPIFVRIRPIHPFLAIGAGVLMLALATLAPVANKSRLVARLSRALSVGFFVQVALGVLNLKLLAPTWLQLLHLASADVVWVVLVLLASAALGEPGPSAQFSESREGALAGSPPAR
jgi:heme A synthase